MKFRLSGTYVTANIVLSIMDILKVKRNSLLFVLTSNNRNNDNEQSHAVLCVHIVRITKGVIMSEQHFP